MAGLITGYGWDRLRGRSSNLRPWSRPVREEFTIPTRILREGILDSKRINALSEEAELFYRRLMSVVDDYGRFEADPVLLRARCFARQLDRWPVERIEKCLLAVSSRPLFDRRLQPLVVLYTVDGRNYLEIQDFQQRIRTESRFPRSSDVGDQI